MGGNSNQVPAGTPLVYAPEVLDAIKSTSAVNPGTAAPVINFFSTSTPAAATPAAQPKKPMNPLHMLLLIAGIIVAILVFKNYVK